MLLGPFAHLPGLHMQVPNSVLPARSRIICQAGAATSLGLLAFAGKRHASCSVEPPVASLPLPSPDMAWPIARHATAPVLCCNNHPQPGLVPSMRRLFTWLCVLCQQAQPQGQQAASPGVDFHSATCSVSAGSVLGPVGSLSRRCLHLARRSVGPVAEAAVVALAGSSSFLAGSAMTAGLAARAKAMGRLKYLRHLGTYARFVKLL